MAEYIPGLGNRFGGNISAAGQDYLKIVQDAGKELGSIGEGIVKYQAKLGAKKAEALKGVPDADFSKDKAVSSGFKAKAKQLEDKINGVGEDAYDFSKISDQARFDKDVAALNSEIEQFEPIYNEDIALVQKREENHTILVNSGGNLKDAPTLNPEGGNNLYDGKIQGAAYDKNMSEVSLYRDNELKLEPNGSLVLVDDQGEPIMKGEGDEQEPIRFESMTDYLDQFTKVAVDNPMQVPARTAQDVVLEYSMKEEYEDEAKARQSFEVWVRANDNEVRRRMAEKKGRPLESIDDVPSSEEGDLKKYQEEYIEDMLNEWRTRPEEEDKLTSQEQREQQTSQEHTDHLSTIQPETIDNLNELSEDLQGYEQINDGASVGVLGGEALRFDNVQNFDPPPETEDGTPVTSLNVIGFGISITGGGPYMKTNTNVKIPIEPGSKTETAVRERYDAEYGRGSYKEMMEALSAKVFPEQ